MRVNEAIDVSQDRSKWLVVSAYPNEKALKYMYVCTMEMDK